jgi:hypothetical protein
MIPIAAASWPATTPDHRRVPVRYVNSVFLQVVWRLAAAFPVVP